MVPWPPASPDLTALLEPPLLAWHRDWDAGSEEEEEEEEEEEDEAGGGGGLQLGDLPGDDLRRSASLGSE